MAINYRYPLLPNNRNMARASQPLPVEKYMQEAEKNKQVIPTPAPLPVHGPQPVPTPQPAPVSQQVPMIQPEVQIPQYMPTPSVPVMPAPAAPVMPVSPCPIMQGTLPMYQPPVNYGQSNVMNTCPLLAYNPLNPTVQGYPMMNPSDMEDMYYTDEMDFGPATTRPGDPPPILSNNPAVQTISLFKELTGYNNYGNPSGNADILYTGNRGTWTFDIPGNLFAPGNRNAQLIISAVLDDHYNVPINRYSATITVNGVVVHNGLLPLEHGAPANSRFTNWRPLTFNITNFRRNTRIVIVNTSNAGPNDWIALDWMELRQNPRI